MSKFESYDSPEEDIFQQTLRMLVVQPYGDKLSSSVDTIFEALNLDNQVLRSFRDAKKQSKKSAKRVGLTAKSHPIRLSNGTDSPPADLNAPKAPQTDRHTQTDTATLEYSRSVPNGQIRNEPLGKKLQSNPAGSMSLLKKRTFSCNF